MLALIFHLSLWHPMQDSIGLEDKPPYRQAESGQNQLMG
jgi:hypothetical protein